MSRSVNAAQVVLLAAVGFALLSGVRGGAEARRAKVRAAPLHPDARIATEVRPLVTDAPPAELTEPPPGNDRDTLTEAAQQARGAYFSGPYLRRGGAAGVIRTLERARLNAAVIDLKDGQGRVTYDSAIPVLEAQERHFISDPAAMVQELHAAGVHTIARIVCFADPVLPRAVPARGIVDNRPGLRGRPWVSWGTGGTWLDPYNTDNHDLVVALAREAAAFGFDEIQLDYIRFPVDDGVEYAVYPADDGRERHEVLRSLLERVDAAVDVPLGVDVFGLTAFDFGSAEDLGQELESWIPHVEIFTPMLYLNSMSNWGHELENRSLALIRAGSGQLRRRLGPGPVIRPFLQGFPQGADTFDQDFIADQVRGARLGRADGFLFWHPRSNYAMVTRGMRGPGRALSPFPLGERAGARRGPAAAPLLR